MALGDNRSVYQIYYAKMTGCFLCKKKKIIEETDEGVILNFSRPLREELVPHSEIFSDKAELIKHMKADMINYAFSWIPLTKEEIENDRGF